MTSRIIYISSDDQDPSESKSNSEFVVYLKEKVKTQDVKHVVIKDCTVPNVFYNVRSSYGEVNNTFVFQESGEAVMVATIAEGQYTTSTLMTTLETAMNALLVVASVTIAQDPITQLITWTFVGDTVNIFGQSTGNPLGEVVGVGDADSGAVAAFTAPFLPDLAGIQNTFIQSSEIAPAQGIDGDFGAINIAEQVSLSDTPFSGYAYRKNDDEILNLIDYPSTRNLNRIDITLVDSKGNILPIGNSRLAISLMITY